MSKQNSKQSQRSKTPEELVFAVGEGGLRVSMSNDELQAMHKMSRTAEFAIASRALSAVLVGVGQRALNEPERASYYQGVAHGLNEFFSMAGVAAEQYSQLLERQLARHEEESDIAENVFEEPRSEPVSSITLGSSRL